MASTRAIADPHASRTITSKLRDYYALTKPEVNLLILMTTSAGYYLGSQGPLRPGRLFITLVGTLLVASGTATLNQLMERLYDAQMRRTANRPLVSGRLSPREARWLGLSLSVAGGVSLAVWVNAVSALLAIGTLLGYLLVYTPLKRKTPLCTLLGAVPGAMPTLIGWAASSSSVGRNAWLLFGVLFLWQFPHFLAIALLYREDYPGAGFRMLPRFDTDGRQGGDCGVHGCPGDGHHAACGGPEWRNLLADHVHRRGVFSISHGQAGSVGLPDAGPRCRSCLGDLFASGPRDHDGLEGLKHWVVSQRGKLPWKQTATKSKMVRLCGNQGWRIAIGFVGHSS